MRLETWRRMKGLSFARLADLIGVANGAAARRYCLGLQYPRPEIADRIIAVTDGSVMPNDLHDARIERMRSETFQPRDAAE